VGAAVPCNLFTMKDIGRLHIAWLSLIGLSIASTALSFPVLSTYWPTATGLSVLLFAWLKARIILAEYLGLAAAPRWQRGFNHALGALCLTFSALYLAPLLY
jgi:Zn-dependent protease